MAHGKKTKRQKRQLAKKQTGVTVGEFINRIRDDLFRHTTSTEVSVEFNLSLSSKGFLRYDRPQHVALKVLLEGPQGAKQQG